LRQPLESTPFCAGGEEGVILHSSSCRSKNGASHRKNCDTSLKQAQPIAAYDQVREQLSKMLTPEMFGDPKATSAALLKVVDADKPPLHVIFGPLLPMVKQVYETRIQSWEQWNEVSRAAYGR
jgi:hypothetical protein